jgi:protein O-mannosyl-transferase
MDRIKDTWRTLLVCSLLAAVTLAAYWPARHFDFLNWDDLTYVSKNDHVRGGLTWSGFLWSFTQSYCCNWHPLTWLSHMLDCQLYGLNAGEHHLTSLLLHSVNASLLFVALKRLTGALWRSALVAALFALHPLHVESVAWIAERKDVLSAFFFMLTLWAYARYAEGRREKVESRKQQAASGSQNPEAGGPWSVVGSPSTLRSAVHPPQGSGGRATEDGGSLSHLPSPIFYLLALLFFALGLMSKPMLVTLPFVLLLLDYWPLSRFAPSTKNPEPKTVLPLVLEKTPFLALSATSCIITFLAQKRGGAVTSFEVLPLDTRLANAVVAYVQYVAKLFWPARLSPIYLHPNNWGPWLVTGAAAVLVLLTAAVWRGRHRFPYALMGWLWFVGMLVPVIGIVQVGNQAFADRYTYLPLVGIMVALVWLGAESIGKGIVAVLLSLALLATLGWRTREQLPTWKDTGALFGRALALDPANVQALYGVGANLVDIGRLDEGKRYLEEAIRLHPDYPEALGTLASTFSGQGNYAEAIRFYRAALKAQPNHEGALNNLAWLLASCPDAAFRNGPEAVRFSTRACQLTDYTKPLLIGTLAAAQAEAGDFQAAIATAERAAALATSLRLDDVAARNRELIQLYRQGQPYHEKRETTTDGHR